MTDYVCGRCGSPRIDKVNMQRSVDARYPLAICWNCRDGTSIGKDKNSLHTPLSPIIPAAHWHERVRIKAAKPESLWDDLPQEEQRKLARPSRR